MSGPALSVLSVDLAGDARLSRKLDAREVGYVLGRCEKRIRYALKRHGGSVVSRTDRHLTAFCRWRGGLAIGRRDAGTGGCVATLCRASGEYAHWHLLRSSFR